MNLPVPATVSAVRVLVASGIPEFADAVLLALGRGRYVTQVVWTIEDASAAAAWLPHLAVVDLEMASGWPLEDLVFLGPGRVRMPTIALTRRTDLAAKLGAFRLGADDVLTLPFAPDELLARIEAVVRRTAGPAAPMPATLRLGELEMDALNCRVRVGGRVLRLTALDHGLLYLLAVNAGRVVSRDEILDHLWGDDFEANSNVVDRHIRTLRAVLRDDWRRPRFVATVPGRGYRIVVAPPVGPSPSLSSRRAVGEVGIAPAATDGDGSAGGVAPWAAPTMTISS